jgi:NMT1/THI5 like
VQTGSAAALTAIAAPAVLAAPAAKLEKTKLTIAIPVDAASFLPVYLAAARTWKEQGLDAELTAFRGDAEVSQALLGGSIDISVQSGDGLVNIVNTSQPAIGFYAGFHQSDYGWIAQPSIKTWADLKGKAAGVSTFGSQTDQLTRYVLRRHGLVPEKDVQIVQAGPPASIVQALRSASWRRQTTGSCPTRASRHLATRERTSRRNGQSTCSLRRGNFWTKARTPCGRSCARTSPRSGSRARTAISSPRPTWTGSSFRSPTPSAPPMRSCPAMTSAARFPTKRA